MVSATKSGGALSAWLKVVPSGLVVAQHGWFEGGMSQGLEGLGEGATDSNQSVSQSVTWFSLRWESASHNDPTYLHTYIRWDKGAF